MIEILNGYEFIVCSDSKVPLSNLIAIANGADPNIVFDEGTHVHHKNEIRWDNRPNNLVVEDRKDHLKYHFENNEIFPGKDRPDWWDKEKLKNMYSDLGMTQQEIADEIDVSQKSVSSAFEKLGIETRSRGSSSPKPWHDADLLYDLYIDKDMSQREVANELDVSEPTVRKWLRKTGVWPPS